MVLDLSGEAILSCDNHGQVTHWNRRARQLLGPAPAPLPPGHILRQALERGAIHGLETTVQSPHGDAVSLLADAAPVHENGIRTGAAAILHEPARLTGLDGMLSSSLDAEGLLRASAQWCVSQLADWCAVDLVADSGELNRVAAAHRNPSKAELVWEISRREPLAAYGLAARAIGSGRPEFLPEVAPDGNQSELMRELGMRSYLVAPMRVAGRVIGAITMVYSDSPRTYSEADLAPAEELAARTALAAENARLSSLVQSQKSDMELLLESTGEGIYGMDTSGLCTFINGSAASMLGYRREDLLGTDMHSRIHHSHPDGRSYPVEECTIHLALREGRGCRADDEVFFCSDGSAFPVEYSAYPIFEQSVVRGAVVTFNDITARRRSEAAIRESEARYRGLFDNVSEGVYQTSPNGELLAANPALVRMLGFESEQEIRALDVADLYVNALDRTASLARLEGDNFLRNARIRLKRRDGAEISVIENARVVRNDRGAVLYYEGTLRPLS